VRISLRIEHDCGSLEPRRDLREQFKPLASQRGFQVGEAGDVPPGRSSRGTRPLATGSPRFTKTIGIVGVSRRRATVAWVEPTVTMISGCEPTNSCASARIRLVSAPAQRRSIRTLRPSVQPKSASACVNAETRRFGSGSFSSYEHADAPHALALLRVRRERPRRHAAESSDEFSSCNGGGHLPAPVLKPKANNTMIGTVVSSGPHNSMHGRMSARGHEAPN
jgi:hypothetical protein